MTRAEHDKRYAEKQTKVNKMFGEGQNMDTLEKTIEIGNDRIEIWRHGVDDYSANCSINGVLNECGGWSLRGSLMEVMQEIFSIFADEIFNA